MMTDVDGDLAGRFGLGEERKDQRAKRYPAHDAHRCPLLTNGSSIVPEAVSLSSRELRVKKGPVENHRPELREETSKKGTE